MKKSFTLKAFAFGAAAAVAISASATPHEFLKADFQPQRVTATKSNVKAADITLGKLQYSLADQQAKAPAAPAKRAEANYGAWGDELDCEYICTQLWSKNQTFNYKYQRRDDSANPGNFQIKIINFLNQAATNAGADLILNIEKGEDGKFYIFSQADGTNLNFTIGDGTGATYDCYYFDHYNWIKKVNEFFDADDKYTDEQVESFKTNSNFDPETGVGILLPTYCPEIDEATAGMALPYYTLNSAGTAIESWKYEQFRLSGPNFKNYDVELDTDLAYFGHEKDATSGTYTLSYNMNDNTQVVFRMVTGRKTGNALETAFSQMIDDLANAPDDILVCDQKEATVSVPVTQYRKGQYTLLVGYTHDGTNYSGFGINTLRIFDEDLDYYNAGTAEYTDCSMYDALPAVFGAENGYGELMEMFESEAGITLPDLNDTYTVTVPLQANSKVEGEYRLVHPYAEYYNNYLSQFLYYDAPSDFLLFNAADANKCFILPSATGIYFPTQAGSEIMMVFGSTNKMQGGNANSANVWGTYAGGEITFPEPIIPENATSLEEVTSAISWSQATFSSTSGTVTYKEWSEVSLYSEVCKISAALAGVENVVADAEFDTNAPVEYFNLQGIRVATPEAGQLLIKRQGKKAEKVVIR